MVEILDNPHFKAAVALQERKDKQIGNIAEHLLSTKTWSDMSAGERKFCMHHVVAQAESQQDLEDRIRKEFGLSYFDIDWYLPEPNDKTGEEARMIVKALGGMVSKNGALVSVLTTDMHL